MATASIATPAMTAGNTQPGTTYFGPRMSRISSSGPGATAVAVDAAGMPGWAAGAGEDAGAGAVEGAGAGAAHRPAPRNRRANPTAATARMPEKRPLIRVGALGF